MIEAFSTQGCAGPAALELGNEVSNYKIDDVMSCTLSTGTLDKIIPREVLLWNLRRTQWKAVLHQSSAGMYDTPPP